MMIGIDTPLGYWLGMIVAFLAASALSRIPFLRKEELLPEGRHVALDGLRGLLAPAVVFHHMFLFRQWQLTGEWSNASGIYTLLGPIPVAIFFMLTGFLFWEKAIRADGQIHAWSLYKGPHLPDCAPIFTACTCGRYLDGL